MILEVLASKYAYDKYNESKEGFTSSAKDYITTILAVGYVATILMIPVLLIVLNIWATGTSWLCNSVIPGRWFITKVWYAFLSSLLAPLYLLSRYFKIIKCSTPL